MDVFFCTEYSRWELQQRAVWFAFSCGLLAFQSISFWLLCLFAVLGSRIDTCPCRGYIDRPCRFSLFSFPLLLILSCTFVVLDPFVHVFCWFYYHVYPLSPFFGFLFESRYIGSLDLSWCTVVDVELVLVL